MHNGNALGIQQHTAAQYSWAAKLQLNIIVAWLRWEYHRVGYDPKPPAKKTFSLK